jgi:hypothetical protein
MIFLKIVSAMADFLPSSPQSNDDTIPHATEAAAGTALARLQLGAR